MTKQTDAPQKRMHFSDRYAKAEADDLVQAAVAAALREAAQVARASFDGEIGYDEILDLIPEDAQAALDRVVWEERERGFWAGRSCGGSKAEIDAALNALCQGGE